MQLILKTGTDCYYQNLLMSNKVAIIIPDKYSNATFCDIMLAERCVPNQ